MTDEATKLEAFKRIHEGESLSDLVMTLGVPYPKLRAWKKELKEAVDAGTVHTLIDIPKEVVQKAAEETQQQLAEFVTTEEELNAIEGEVQQAIQGVEGLQELNVEVQKTASKLTQHIAQMATDTTDAKDLALLVDALAKIQNAFFNKAIVQLPSAGETVHPLGMFKDAMRA
jgi:hypothetical protein